MVLAHMIRKSLTITRVLNQQLKIQSAYDGVSDNETITRAVVEYLNRRESQRE